MGNAYINTIIEIPNVFSIDPTPAYASDEGTTADNSFRNTVIGSAKRAWKVQARLLTSTQYNAIYNYLASISFGACPFWLYIFGGTAAANSINCYIKFESNNISVDRQFNTSGGWEDEPHDISLSIREQ